MMNKRIVSVGTVGAIATSAATYLVMAVVPVDEMLPVEASLLVSAEGDNCDNSPGPTISLEGELTLGGLNAVLIFRNNLNNPHHEHEEDVEVDITVLEPGEVITFAKQPPEGGVGGNPWIFLQLFDDSWMPISDRVLLGRCVQGLDPQSFEFLYLTDLAMEVEGTCSNNPGPYITLEGELAFGGINAILSFQNSQNNPPHVHDEVVDVEFTILDAGETIQFNKQPPLGGVGGNPWISIQFTDGNGIPVSDEILLGRCNKL